MKRGLPKKFRQWITTDADTEIKPDGSDKRDRGYDVIGDCVYVDGEFYGCIDKVKKPTPGSIEEILYGREAWFLLAENPNIEPDEDEEGGKGEGEPEGDEIANNPEEVDDWLEQQGGGYEAPVEGDEEGGADTNREGSYDDEWHWGEANAYWSEEEGKMVYGA